MTTIDRVKKVISNITGIAEENLTDYSYFVYDLSISSITTAEIFMEMEREFNIDIPSIMSRNICINDLALYIDSALKRKKDREKAFAPKTVINVALFNLARKKSK